MALRSVKVLRSRMGRLGLAGLAGLGVASFALPAVVRQMDRHRQGGREGENPTCPPGLEMEAISADGTRLHLVVHGAGERVVFLVHGWTCDHTIYRYQQRYLESDYKVVSLDLRGHGRSAIPASLDYRTDRLAEDLKAAVDLIDPSSFVIAGHSMGGFTAFRFAARFGQEYRERLKGLVIIDSSGLPLVEGVVMGRLMDLLYPFPLDPVLRLAGRFGRLVDPFKAVFKKTPAAYMLVRWAAFGKKPVGHEVDLMREMCMSTSMTSVSLAAKSCIDCDNVEALSHIDVPVLMLAGRHDKLTNQKVNERTVGLLSDARLVLYPGAGHCALIEDHEKFNEEMGGFIEQVMA
jgi:non-heme chloroperoxidase